MTVFQGDSMIRYFEVNDEAPYIHYLNMYQSPDPPVSYTHLTLPTILRV